MTVLSIHLVQTDFVQELIKAASAVKEPIALAALFAAILFLVFRIILSMNIFEGLGSEGTKTVVLWIITGLFILCILTAGLGFAGYVIKTRYPTLLANYVDVGLGEDQPLEQVVNAVKISRNVTIEFVNCSDNVKASLVEKGNHNGADIKNFLEKLRERIRGPQPSYHVDQKGDSRYEIICP